MAWRATGDERAKRFNVYRELEQKYDLVLAENAALRRVIEEKNRSITQLAKELSGALYGPTSDLETAIPETPDTEDTLEKDEPLPVPTLKPLAKASLPATGPGRSMRDILTVGKK